MSIRSTDVTEAVDHLPAGATLLIQDISWEEYEQLLDELDDRPGIRVTYDSGNLEIMSPGQKHGRYKRAFERMVDALADHLQLNVESYGSATWKREDLRKGTEPDSCFYVANAERIIGKDNIDLPVDPPPDVAVEIDSTRRSVSKFAIYSSLEIPEIWRYDVKKDRVHIYELRGDDYVEVSASRSFPILTAEVLLRFLQESRTHGQGAAIAAFKQWLKQQ